MDPDVYAFQQTAKFILKILKHCSYMYTNFFLLLLKNMNASESDHVFNHVSFSYILSVHAASSSIVLAAAHQLRAGTMMLIYLQSFIIIITVSSGLANFNPLDKIPPCNYDKVRTYML